MRAGTASCPLLYLVDLEQCLAQSRSSIISNEYVNESEREVRPQLRSLGECLRKPLASLPLIYFCLCSYFSVTIWLPSPPVLIRILTHLVCSFSCLH